MTTLAKPTRGSDSHDTGGLASASFLGLVFTQFLGALNDNMFRMLAIGIGKDHVGSDRASFVISAGMVCFTVPYLLLAVPAGFFADRFSKRTVIVVCKVAEMLIMAMAVAAIYFSHLYLLFFVLLLMGAHSALYGPSKLGSIPEMLHSSRISAANGILGLATVGASAIGFAAGGLLKDATGFKGEDNVWLSAAALIGVAFVGTLCSLLIRPLMPVCPDLKFPRNALKQTVRDLATLAENRAILRVAVGIAFFWSLAALAQSNILEFVREGGLQEASANTPMMIALVVGIGAGSVLAGIWSAGKVELGILPLGAAGISLSSMLLFTVHSDLTSPQPGWSAPYVLACVWLVALGISAGLFDVPLSSFMQHRSPPEKRGVILAASNFLTFSGVLLSAGIYYVLRAPLRDGGEPLFTASQIFLLAGAMTVLVFLYIVLLIPQASIRFAVWLASKTIYRITIHGREHLPERGGALLVCNHVTWIDGALLLMISSRPIRMLAHADFISGWWIRWLANLMGAIPIVPGKRSVVQSIETARQALRDGELVCVFPEGGLTRTGRMNAFKPGLLAIAADTGAPILPVYLDELWGSIFSFERGRFFWKWPRSWPYRISIHFGRALPQVVDVRQVQRAVEELGVQAVQHRQHREMILPRRFLRMCRRTFFRPKMADSLGTELTGGKLLIGSLTFRRALINQLLAADEKYVGVLLPPSVGAAVVNVALPLANRIAVNLNYTVSTGVMNSCIAQCGIKHVLTTRKMMDRLNLQLDAQIVYLDDFKQQIGAFDKLIATLQASIVPVRLLERLLGLLKIQADDVLTVIFTSGSTGEPKGVMLTHANIASNIEAVTESVNLSLNDVAIGVLPFFHSYGYTATLWTALAFEPKGVYHFDPRDAGQIGKLVQKHRGTLLLSTPTFLRFYLRRCQPEDLKSLEVIFTGAEKLPAELAKAFEEKFGVRPFEAYGATELAPLVSFNVPPKRSSTPEVNGAKDGSVGRPIPGVLAKVVDPETGAELGVDMPGMLLIKGPNVMKGYLHRPDLTAKALRDGWYVTGDIARIDSEGFIFITGRESRFSKIGGEMVPHIKIEETLQKIIGAGEDELRIAVTAVQDPKRGERLIVFHTPVEKPVTQICKELQECGLPNIWIPSPDSFSQVDEIPVLGTGKLDLKGLKTLAEQKFQEI